MSLFDRFRQTAAPSNRRDFFRRVTGAGVAVAAVGTLGADDAYAADPAWDDAWGAVEERAARFGIVPGTVVDAQGRPMHSNRPGGEPYIGEIGIFGGNFEIRGHAFCNGQLLSIAQNTALYAILGTTFGGDGQTTFALPDLRGRVPVHAGGSPGPGLAQVVLGQVSGTENTTLLSTQMPQHVHPISGTPVSSAPGTTPDPTGAYLARPASSIPQYVAGSPTPTGTLAGTSGVTGQAGGSQPFSIRDPYLGLNYFIALVGIFPSRN
ncbi:MAG TPA: tail fiber protein [Rubricoccaceae bacterium]|jgi:microcystin-dependent protein